MLLRCVFVLGLVVSAAARMSRAQAAKELGVRPGVNEKELKAAYRKRSLQSHPDKGGSTEEFLRVSEAFEVLSGSGGGRGGGNRGGGGRGGGAADQDEAMRRAEEMMDQVMSEMFEMMERVGSGGTDDIVESFMGNATGFFSPFWWVMKKGVKYIARAAAGAVVDALQGDGVEININGETMSFSDFKEWRDSRRNKVSRDAGSARQEMTDL